MRKDGKKIKITDPMYTLVPYIMEKRYDSMNMIELDIPIAPIQAYINKKRREDISISHMGVLIAAYVRTAAEFESLNRFIMNKKIYQRNEFAVGMVVLKPGTDEGTMNKMYFEMTDTIFDVHRKMNEYIELNRKPGAQNNTDALMKTLLSIPGLVTVAVAVLKWMDRHNILPKAIIDASPFHTSVGISNLGSIRTNHIFHHCYEFGTTSIFITMGNLREVPKRVKGEIVFERCLPLGVVMDERICSGSYFARVFARMKEYFANPELLEAPPEKVNTILG